MASSVPPRSGCVSGPSRGARTQNRRSKYPNFGDVPGFYPHRQTNRNPAFPCALCTKVHNSATRVQRPARARIRRTRRHPRTSGERWSVRRDCRRRAGSARVDGRAHGVHRRSYLKSGIVESHAFRGCLKSHAPVKAPLPDPAGNLAARGVRRAPGAERDGGVRVVPRRGGCGVLLQR